MIAVEVDTQRVPLAGHDLHVGSLLLGAFAFDGVVDGHVVLEAIGARDVVVVSVLQPPDDAARLIFLTANRFEFHLDESIFDIGVRLETNRKSRLT